MSSQEKPTASNKSNFVKYIGMPFQLLAIIGISAYLGSLIDKKMESDNQYFMLAFALISLVAFLFKIVKTESL